MEYRPLNISKNEIRLLTIIPPVDDDSNGNTGSPCVRCKLQHHSLDEFGPGQKSSCDVSWLEQLTDRTYVALSYYWGTSGFTHEIKINDAVVKITENLEGALYALSKHNFSRKGGKVFADGICINQNDATEKAHEVRRMQEVYKRAEDTVVWLGEKADGSDDVMDFVNDLSGCFELGAEESGAEQKLRSTLPGVLARYDPDIWSSITKFMSRPYWERLWVMQELVAGSERMPILCGEKVITWHDLRTVLHFFNGNGPKLSFNQILAEQLHKDGGRHISRLQLDRVHWRWERVGGIQALKRITPESPDELWFAVLSKARQSKVTNARDKVYGIAGLLRPKILAELNVNYNVSPESVYHDFSKAWLLHSGNLELLTHCDGLVDSMPSWVPDLRNERFHRLTGTLEQRHCAGARDTIGIRFSNDGQKLIVKGILVDTVDGFSTAFENSEKSFNDTDRRENNAWHTLYQPSGISNAYGYEEAIREAIWRTMIGNRDLIPQTAPQGYESVLFFGTNWTSATTKYSTWHNFLLENQQLRIGGRVLKDYCTEDWNRRDCTIYEDVLERVNRFLPQRRLIVTKKGYVGAAPQETRVGDLICCFPGCSCPVLLRRCRQGLRIVGHCYVHGLMNGEAFAVEQNLDEFMIV